MSEAEALGLRGCLKMLYNRHGHDAHSDTHKHGIRSDAVLGCDEHLARVKGLVMLGLAIELVKKIGHELAMAFDPSFVLAPNVQIACFARPGSRYGRHGDNLTYAEGADPAGAEAYAPSGFRNWRALTVLLYCNTEWQPEHGGCLRMYDGGGEGPPPVSRLLEPVSSDVLRAEKRYTDIEPIAGRIVAFNSLLHHEVLPAHKPRFAITLWVWKEDGADKFAFS